MNRNDFPHWLATDRLRAHGCCRGVGADTPLISAPATVTDATNGGVSYSFSASDSAVAGQCEGEMEVTFALVLRAGHS